MERSCTDPWRLAPWRVPSPLEHQRKTLTTISTAAESPSRVTHHECPRCPRRIQTGYRQDTDISMITMLHNAHISPRTSKENTVYLHVISMITMLTTMLTSGLILHVFSFTRLRCDREDGSRLISEVPSSSPPRKSKEP